MPDVAGSIWTHWHAHPEALLGLTVLEGAYLFAVGPLRERYNLADEIDPRHVATFTAGVLVIFVALLSPIHELSDNYLFSAHMIQHVLLTLIAPPLLIIGCPDWVLRPLLRPNLAFRAARALTHPVAAFGAFNVIFSMWHIPSLYNLSVNSHWVHVLEHLMFMGAAVLMWWPIASMMPELPRLAYPLQMAYLFLLSVAQLIVFAPVTFSSEPLYQSYVKAPRIWGISALTDQQMGGIIMKMGGAVLFLALIVVLFFRWFGEQERRREAEEAKRDLDRYRLFDGREPEETRL